MIGKYQLQIGAKEIATGMASSIFANDGAFSPTAYGMNPFVQPGVIYPMVAETDKSTNVAGNLIASCEASGISTSYNRLMVDDAANYYTVDSSSNVTKQKTGTATTHYKFGKTDMVPFGGQIYVSLDNDVAQWDGGSTLDEDWGTTVAGWTFNSNNLWHPMIVFESLLWVADGNNLHNFDSGTTFATPLTINSNESIVALGIDPATGLMLISFQTQALGNYNDTANGKNFIGLYDGYSSKLRRKIPTDDLVTAFYNVGGTVYVGYGQRLGAWNGNGITFLRKLPNVTLTAADLPYKHHFTNLGNILMVVDGRNVLAYGEVMGGTQKRWFNIWKNNTGSNNNLGIICNLGSNNLGISFSSSKFYTIPLMNTSGTPSANENILNNIYFPRPVQIRRVRFITTGVTGANSDAIILALTDEKNNSSFFSNATRFWNIPSGETRYVFDVDCGGAYLQGATVNWSMNGSLFGLIKIIIYYDTAE